MPRSSESPYEQRGVALWVAEQPGAKIWRPATLDPDS